jgi:hypothetical protein
MKFLLDELQAQQNGAASVYTLSALQRSYGCRCSRAIFFRNSHCLNCDTPLGYEPQLGKVFSLAPGPDGDTWQLAGPYVPDGHYDLYRRCANANTPASCNWLVDKNDLQTFCISCRLNRTIPDLSNSENGALWGKVEDAKRRVLSALIALGLPITSRAEDPERGLAFDLLRASEGGPRVMTGHHDGLITINIEEADDVKREQMRTSMHEHYRTLVGHFRHEIGHYYWDRLIEGTTWIESFRGLFGDERADYNVALQKNYRTGPDPGWPTTFVSAYASVHPWEDWAETWAHYMHMVDTLGTAVSFGLKPDTIAMPFEPFEADVLWNEKLDDDAERFLSFLNSWLKLSAVMNELCRSMGQPDFYPFALTRRTVTKLHYIHLLVCQASTKTGLRVRS